MAKSANLWICLLLKAMLMQTSMALTNEHYDVEAVSKESFDLGEGPFWRNETLYFVDCAVGDLHCFDFEPSGKIKEQWKINLGGLVSIVIPVEGSNGDVTLATLRNKIVKVNWNTKQHEVIATVAEERAGKERFNDGKIDARGRLWIGTVLEDCGNVVPGGGSLYKLDDNKLVKMADNFTLCNGMAWTKNNTIMYFNDSEGQKIYKFDFDLENGTISNKKVLIDVAKDEKQFKADEYPDGMTIDSEDHILSALWGGGRIVRIDPSTARVIESIYIPSPFTTSLTFGGGNLDELYVTTALQQSKGMNAGFADAGKVFRVRAKSNTHKLAGPSGFEAKI